jgi:hypothetical protein
MEPSSKFRESEKATVTLALPCALFCAFAKCPRRTSDFARYNAPMCGKKLYNLLCCGSPLAEREK